MPNWRDEIAKMTPAQIRERNREVYRIEVGQPGVKWRMFQEQCRKEQRGLACLESNPQHSRAKEPSPAVQTVLKRLRYMADRHVKQHGGQASSNLRQIFLHWDGSNSGTLSTANLIGALTQVGVPVSRDEAEEVMVHYSVKETAGVDSALWEIPISKILNDAAKGAPGLLEQGEGEITRRLMGSSRSHATLLGVSRRAKHETAMIRAFRTKLQQVIDKRVRYAGGSPGRLLQSLLLNWDTKRDGILDTSQLRGALATLNMRLSATQAREVSRYYAKNGDAANECDIAQLVEDICGYDQGPIVHEMLQGKTSTADGGSELGRRCSSSSSPLTAGGRRRSRGSSRGESGGWSGRDTGRASLSFTARPLEKPPNRVVDRFKLRLRDALEVAIKNKGGVSHAIIRDAFLDWDADASGKLDPRELVGALKKMKVHVTDEEARAVVAYYDVDGSGEMSYGALCEEIKKLSHPILSYVEEVDVLNGLDRAVREPANVKKALAIIRAGLGAALQRSCPSSSRGGGLFPGTAAAAAGEEGTGAAVAAAATQLPPISARDLLEGTCLRFDRENGRGVIGVNELRQVWRELRVSLRTSETKALVAWFDRSTSGKLHASDLCDAVFGRRLSRETTADRQQRQLRPPPPPRKPHVLQAQRAAALAMGESSYFATGSGGGGGGGGGDRGGVAHPTRLPAPGGARENRRRAAEKRRQQRARRDDRIAWNWQGRASVAGGVNEESGGGGVNKPPHGAVAKGSGGGLLRASGEAVVAEKARIQRRLKELQQERAALLREKRGVECWAETAGVGARPPPHVNCAA